MQITIDRTMPPARGVTQLMYVGDDEAVEKAVKPPNRLVLAGAAVASFVALTTHNRPERAFAAGVAALCWWKILRRS